jgi:glucose/arabinose dehydrogenase
VSACAALVATGCSGSTNSDAGTDAGPDAFVQEAESTDVVYPHGDGAIAYPCALPGSIQYTNAGTTVVPGGMSSAPDLSWVHVPAGYCVHYYGNVGNTRQLRFAPGGELFVASPTTGTTGGGPGGHSAIVVMPDDNSDGYADGVLTFQGNLPSTQGLLFTPGTFYYQDGTKIMMLPYAVGQRAASGTATVAADFTAYSSPLHWPKVMDVADDGTIFFTNGGDQGESCDSSRPFHGGILRIDGSAQGAQVAKGLRNPIALKCQRGHNMCFALELAMDYSNSQGGREKLLPVRQGDDWGFPCCATQNVPYSGTVDQDGAVPDCSATAPEIEGFYIGDTPFGIDFEPGNWPAPYNGAAFVVLHGIAGSWKGERLVAVTVDATTGMPTTGNDITNMVDTGGMGDFATGWDDGSRAHGRPAAVVFSPDGRLFVGNDNDGNIFWIAKM